MQQSLAHVTQYLERVNSSTRLWLRANTRALTVTSDLLQSLTVLSPSADAEISAQAAATIVAFLTIYRDYPASVNNQSSRLALSLISSSQLLLEMLATRQSSQTTRNLHSKHHLTIITLIETIKALIRVHLLSKTAYRGKILTTFDQILPEATPPPSCTCGMSDIPGTDKVAVKKGTRSGRRIIKVRELASKRPRRAKPNMSNTVIAGLEPIPDALRQHKPTEDPILDALFTIAYERRANWIIRMFMSDAECKACDDSEAVTIRRPTLQETLEGIQTSYAALKSGELAAEVLYICRPVIHLLLIRRFGWLSWKAWCSALLVDLAARLAMAPTTNEMEADERRRRMAQLLLYIGRSPLFDLILRQVIKRMTSPLRKIPLVGGVTSSAIEWVTLLQQYWFYTSGS